MRQKMLGRVFILFKGGEKSVGPPKLNNTERKEK